MNTNSDFEISKPETWVYVSDRPFFWHKVPLYNRQTGQQLTEKELVEFFEVMFAFLERDRKTLTYSQKAKGIRTVLDRMARGRPTAAEKAKNKEWSNAQIKTAMDRLKRRQDAWNSAMVEAETELRAKGFNHFDDNTPGYLERINEIYQNKLQ